ncbi:hypothetical protein [Clostridium intestinale]|uniref:Uncharacterized protein n=1 Tax=Clostridium intestinale URNW TaxID=1294142 RepID=U2PY42_9CLOT|nr:hypothetical protein [Clostridium intestinale]ERK31400.1 hypothetical protein CINTURNW_1687 [Clostridium intestinale URNW]
MQRIIKLPEQLYNYLCEALSDSKQILDIIKINTTIENNTATMIIDIDTKIDLMEYVEDLQLEIGFENQDYLNDDGRKLQSIYDEIHRQTN